MKKPIALLLVLALFAALFAACGKTPEKPDAPATEAPAENTAPAGGLDLEALLRELDQENPDAEPAALCEKLREDPYFVLYTQEEIADYYPALNYDFTPEGVKSAACIWDAFGDSRAFVYVFEAENEDAASALAEALKTALDPYWTETPLKNQLAFSSGARVFFAGYNDGMVPVTGAIAEKARDFVEMFHAYLKENPGAELLTMAKYFASHQKFTAMNTAAVVPGRLTGFGDFEHETEVTGFAEGAAFTPVMSPNTFIGYVFRLADGEDVDAFIRQLEEKANLGWNVCMFADTVITEADGNTVLFMMCSEGTAW